MHNIPFSTLLSPPPLSPSSSPSSRSSSPTTPSTMSSSCGGSPEPIMSLSSIELPCTCSKRPSSTPLESLDNKKHKSYHSEKEFLLESRVHELEDQLSAVLAQVSALNARMSQCEDALARQSAINKKNAVKAERSGPSFFTKLPPEIRNKIYRHVLEMYPNHRLMLQHRSMFGQPKKWERRNYFQVICSKKDRPSYENCHNVHVLKGYDYQYPFYPCHRFLSLLLVCRRMYEEVVPLFYSETFFATEITNIDGPQWLGNPNPNILTLLGTEPRTLSPKLSLLERVSLYLGDIDIWPLPSVEVIDVICSLVDSNLGYLAETGQLKELELVLVGNPFDYGFKSDINNSAWLGQLLKYVRIKARTKCLTIRWVEKDESDWLNDERVLVDRLLEDGRIIVDPKSMPSIGRK